MLTSFQSKTNHNISFAATRPDIVSIVDSHETNLNSLHISKSVSLFLHLSL